MSHIYQPLKLGKFIAILRSLQINYSNKIRIVYMQGSFEGVWNWNCESSKSGTIFGH